MAEDPSSYLPSFSDQMIRDTSSRRVWRCTICNYETTDGKKKGGINAMGEIQQKRIPMGFASSTFSELF